MNKFLLALLFLISFKGFTQAPELDDNTWYLQNVIINGEDNIPPVNAEITDITLDFLIEPYDFNSEMCNSLTGNLSFDDSSSSFTFTELYQTLSTCGLTENSVYESMYFNFYFSNQENLFSYEITMESDTNTLVVTSANGDQAIYGSARLHVNEFKLSEIKTYPNPVVNELVIEKHNSQSLNVNVYNIKGQLMFSETVDQNESVISVSELKPGVYFFVFDGNNYRKEIKKIIKQ
ncbi:T9SS type A sorting domain-containing protein [Hanstruepera ponticola]|uniref:T9SS type A sorting domain-containing protein n=1 Tax=Hanstruepera ponticola TaxID=2042995 RepID=UPI000CF05E5B|nr:T9SS type A sorting domain-containing protein [Hanstruepera ponticola]